MREGSVVGYITDGRPDACQTYIYIVARWFAQVRVMNATNRFPPLLLLALFSLLLAPLAAASNPNDPDGDNDDDGDGYDWNRDGEISDEEMYTNLEEYHNHTNPSDPDTDGGGAWDGWEVFWGFEPRDADDDGGDADGDSLLNVDEFIWDADPYDTDTDQDGMPDGWEHTYSNRVVGGCGLDPTDASDQDGDPDEDGSDNLREYRDGTDPCDADSDDDGDDDGDDPPPIPPGPPDGDTPDTGRTDLTVTILEIFDPALMALKRWSSLDQLYYDSALGDPYRMQIYDTTKQQIHPTNYSGYSHVFEGWLWMGVMVSTTQYTTIPSVSPDADIIAYDPNATNMEIFFYKDGADNYYIRGSRAATIDLKYWMGTNGSYFNRPVPGDLTTSDVPAEAIRPIGGSPSEAQVQVRDFLQHREDNGSITNPSLYWLWPENGTPETNIQKIFNNLTTYFSAFIEGDGDVPDPVPGSGLDIYQTLCINGIGACRHRSFCFFVTANVLGLPTRYISNEAHAFVEVYIPEDNLTYSASHWKRNNLGGTGSSNTVPRPDEGEDGDTFDFGENDPADLDNGNLTGDPVVVVLTGAEPGEVDKGTGSLHVWGYVETVNGTPLGNFSVGFGLWDAPHNHSIVELGSGLTASNGTFDLTLAVPLEAWPGPTEIYAASYERGWLGYDGPESTGIYANTTLTPDVPASVGLGLELVITGSLNDVGGLAAPDESLAFWGWHNESTSYWLGETVTDELGNFVFTCTFTSNPGAIGKWYIYSYFNGSTYLYSSSTNDTLNLMAATVDLNASLEPEIVTLNQQFWVNGSLSGEAWDKGELTIELAGRELLTTAPGDRNWSLALTAPGDLPAGNYTVTVTFVPQPPHDVIYPEGRVTMNLTLTGYATLSLDPLDEALRGTQPTLSGRLIDHLGDPLEGRSVTVAWGGVVVGTVVTHLGGDFAYGHDVSMDNPPGDWNWSALFAGDYFHAGDNASQAVTVTLQPALTFSVAPQHIYPGDGFWVNGTLTMDNGTPLTGEPSFLFDGALLFTVTTNGSFSFYHVPDASYLVVGAHDVEMRFARRGYNLSAEAADTVWLHRAVVLTLEPQQVMRGQPTTLEGAARDPSGTPLTGLTLDFEWDGDGIDVTAVTTGTGYDVAYDVPNAHLLGMVEVTVIFDNFSAPYYDAAQGSAWFTVVSEMTITLDDASVYRGDTIWFNGTMLDDRGDPVQELDLNLFWDDEYLTYFTGDDQGDFSHAHPLAADHAVGPVEVRLEFSGMGWYLPAEQTATYTVWGRTVTNLTDWSPVVTAGENVTFAGTVHDDLGRPLDRDVEIWWNGALRTTVQAQNGDFSGTFTLPGLAPVGNFSLWARIADSNYLRGSQDGVTVTVQRPTTLTLAWEGGFRNTTTAVSGYLRDSSGAGVADVPVTLLLDGTPAGVAHTTAFGAIAYDLFLPPATTLGAHTLTANFAGSYFYLPSETETDGEVHAATTLTVEPLEVQRALNFSIAALLVDDIGTALKGETVNLTLAGHDYALVTDADGWAIWQGQLPADHPLGPFTANLSYAGRDWYLPSMTVQEITVFAPTTLELYIPEGVPAGQQVDFDGMLIDDLGTGLDFRVSIYFDGIFIRFIDTVNGNFENGYIVPLLEEAATHNITALFSGTGHYRPSNATAQFKVYHATALTLEPATGRLNDTVTLTGRVVDTAARPVEGLTVELAIAGGPSASVVSDANGNFSATLPLEFALDVGERNITATFVGNEYYYPNATAATLLVRGGTLLSLDLPAKLEAGQSFSGSARLTLENGNPVAGAQVLVSVGQLTMLATTDDNGSAVFEGVYAGNASVPMEVRVNYNGDNYYESTTTRGTIGYRAPEEESSPLLLIVVAVGAVAAGGAAAYGVSWWRKRHLRDIHGVLAATAAALEAGTDYREAILNSYEEMCRVLQNYGYLRKHFETVREFREAIEQALPLEREPLRELISLYERADYGAATPDAVDRSGAVGSLRSVLTSLDTVMNGE